MLDEQSLQDLHDNVDRHMPEMDRHYLHDFQKTFGHCILGFYNMNYDPENGHVVMYVSRDKNNRLTRGSDEIIYLDLSSMDIFRYLVSIFNWENPRYDFRADITAKVITNNGTEILTFEYELYNELKQEIDLYDIALDYHTLFRQYN